MVLAGIACNHTKNDVLRGFACIFMVLGEIPFKHTKKVVLHGLACIFMDLAGIASKHTKNDVQVLVQPYNLRFEPFSILWELKQVSRQQRPARFLKLDEHPKNFRNNYIIL